MLSKRLQTRIIHVARLNEDRVQRRHRHFSFVCVRSRIIAVGFAQKAKTHNKASKWFPYNSIHSEFDVLRKLNCKLPYGAYVVNVRLGADGNLKLSRPCVCCTRMLIELGIQRLFYSNSNGGFSEWQSERKSHL